MDQLTPFAVLRSELFVTEDVGYYRLTHEIGLPSRAVVDAIVSADAPLEGMVGSQVELQFGLRPDLFHQFRGVIESVELHSRGTTKTAGEANIGYRFTLVSSIGILARSVNSVIHQNKNVPDIVASVLLEHGIDSAATSFRLSGTYPIREYTVQYQESALAFISRLLESEGIGYYVEASEDAAGERIVFFDDSSHADPLESNPELTRRAISEMDGTEPAVFAIDTDERVVPGKVALRGYNFKKPQVAVEGVAAAGPFPALELYDYPFEPLELYDVKHVAQTRLEEEQTRQSTVTITTNHPAMMVGRSIKVWEGAEGRDLFVARVVHECTFWDRQVDPVVGRTGVDYSARAETIPLAVKFRPPRRHRAPRILGPQTATVVAPAGSPEEEIHTDEHGRCKVRFHWDRAGIYDDRASCWMRVTQLQTSGSMALPRVNWEVLVEFLDGNPDRPIVTGRLYNGAYMPPYALPAGATRTSLKTSSTPGGGGTNEIRFEDKAGSEEILIGSQYNTSIVAANNRTTKVGNNETQTIGSNCKLDVGVNQEIKITNGHKCKIGADQSVTVGVNRTVEVNAVTGLTVAGNATTLVSAMQFEMVGSPLAGLIAVAKAKAAAIIEAKVNDAIDKVKGKVQDKIDAVMGPINDVTKKVEKLGGAMEALSDGDLSALPTLARSAGVVSDSTADMANIGFSLGKGGDGAAADPKFKYSDPFGVVGAVNDLNGAIDDVVGGAAGAAKKAASDIIGDVLGTEAGGGGGGSVGNRTGPAGDVDGFSAEDKAAGPGHAQYTITGSHTEKTGAVRLMAALSGINLNVGGSMTQNVTGALVEVVRGDYSEQTKGAKSETGALFGVFTKGKETETSQGPMNCMVGGAVIDKITGDYVVEAKGPASFIGALHKIDAKTKITLKCGASSVVIDGGGVTITSASVDFAGISIKLTKPVAEN